MVQSLDLFAALKSPDHIPKLSEHKVIEIFTEFMDRHYGDTNLLSDYVHILDNHFDTDSLRAIADQLQYKCGASDQCQGIRRHFRGRGVGTESVKMATNHCVDTVDTVHFLLCHLEETGLRIPNEVLLQTDDMKEDDDGDEDNECNLVDRVLKKLVNEIKGRRKARGHIDRLDGQSNTKFTVNTVVNVEVKAQDGMWCLYRQYISDG